MQVSGGAPFLLCVLCFLFVTSPSLPAVAPALDWLLQLYSSLTHQPAPPRDPLVILAAAHWRWHPAPGPNSALWTLLRVTFLGCVWQARSAREQHGGPASIAAAVVAALTQGVQRDWARVSTDVLHEAVGLVPRSWFRGVSPALTVDQFSRMWPAVGGWYQIAAGDRLHVHLSSNWPIAFPQV